ncbi:hypothetical protein L484_021820 [Morus notabilis]|uniref:Uncharacterized protein n=1 Tax=Morus notabilis TaxID=981085 RepID=W9QSP4_9ROSA|nr:hypothetical protein L484_021820 [Morus notabilis]
MAPVTEDMLDEIKNNGSSNVVLSPLSINMFLNMLADLALQAKLWNNSCTFLTPKTSMISTPSPGTRNGYLNQTLSSLQYSLLNLQYTLFNLFPPGPLRLRQNDTLQDISKRLNLHVVFFSLVKYKKS